MTKAELKVLEAQIRSNDIAEANREATKEKAISKLMLSGMKLQDAIQEFNDQVAYFMRGRDGYNRPEAIDAAADVILNGIETSDEYDTMLELMYN